MPPRKAELTLLIKHRQQKRAAQHKRAQKFARPLGIGLLAVVLILLAGALAAGGLYYARVAADLPSLDELPVLLNPLDGELLQPTRVMDRDSQIVLTTLENPGIERRFLVVNPAQEGHFNPQLIRAVVARLDPTFWENPGYDLQHWRDPEPLTIAERLVSDLLMWDEPMSATRAIRMRILAAQVVARFGRTQVLEWYLNSVYFGHLAYGAESASQLYFEKSAQDLTLAESALLAVLIDAPALNPLDAPNAVLEMQRQFLAEMTEGLVITTDEFSSAIRQTLPLRTSIGEPDSLAPLFTHRLLQSLENSFPQNRLARGGLVIQSTLDMELQTQFTCTLAAQLNRLNYVEGDLGSQDCPTALLLPTQVFAQADYQNLAGSGIVLDPRSGAVLAYVDPLTYFSTVEPQSNYEAGSLLTPFTALAAFARGLSPASLQWDVPSASASLNFSAQNPDGQWHGATNIRAAVANDYLVSMAGVTNQVGALNAWRLASALGMNSLADEADSAEVLFSDGSTNLLEVAAAYGTLANSGTQSGAADIDTGEINPNFILSVRSVTNRVLLDRSTPETTPILSQPLSYLINHVLSDESARWPSLGYPNPLEIGQSVAVKMGVLASNQQVWTVGYNPERLVLVWLGNADGESTVLDLDPLMAAGVWHAVMKEALADLPTANWTMPTGVTSLRVCVPSGMLPSADCPSTMQEVFLVGNEPTRVDTLYEMIKVNRETGQRATVFTDPTLIDEQLFINVPEEARAWAIAAGLAVAPSGYDAIPVIQSDPQVTITSPALFSPVSGSVAIEGTAKGASFASYTVQIGEGINPATWLQVGSTGSTAVENGQLAVWDTARLDGLYAIRLNVIGTDQSVRTSTIQVTVDNTLPQVQISYPAAGQEIQPTGETITLQANVQDSSGIQTVEWWLDGNLVATQNEEPFVYLMEADPGKHTLQLVAEDKAGNSTRTNEVDFSIN